MSDETKPWDGRPENPERDGWHWLLGNGGKGPIVEAACWCARRCVWFIQGNDDPMRADQMLTRGWLSYLGPCLLPTQHAALLAERDALRARVDEMDRAWKASSAQWIAALATARRAGTEGGQ